MEGSFLWLLLTKDSRQLLGQKMLNSNQNRLPIVHENGVQQHRDSQERIHFEILKGCIFFQTQVV